MLVRRLTGLFAGFAIAAAAMVAAPAADAGPGYHEPDVGECHDYGLRGLNSESESRKPVSCDEPHTALTVAVVRVPKPVLADPERVLATVGTRCYKKMFDVLGVSTKVRAQTAYSLAYFLPTKAERAKGARWVRCDLYLAGGRKLMNLPDPLVDRPLDDSVTRCLQIRRGTALTTVCSRSHDYRVAGVVKLRGAYPGPERFKSLAGKRCPRLAGPKGYYTFPSRVAWSAGDKRLTCYRKTHK